MTSKSEQVYLKLRDDIEREVFSPGQLLPEEMLTAHTGFSRTPIREALRRLAAENLVTLEPRRAPMVAEISIRTARELFDDRRILEPAALRMVAVDAGRDPLVGRDFARLAAAFRSMPDDEGFTARFQELATGFDDLVIARTPNAFLARQISSLRSASARLRTIAHTDDARRGESAREHVEMCDAVLEASPERAAIACAHHLFHVERSILDRLRERVGAAGV
ncbi:GntR family transcriptional regulator [Microbacterium sp.]|uniref:GntR family transcriptional regulator n=1 Tax=Microbacterium sp. TaxID=51671 RepID=UPI003A903E23